MPARILVVDDEVGMQIALREVLQRLGHQVTVKGDGAAALSALEEESFDLVLTDVRMPELSGLELLDHLRVRWPKLPAVIMTAYGTVEDAVEAMKKGAADYLLKPFSSETIEQLVARQLKNQAALTADPEEPEPSDQAKGGNSHADPIAVSSSMRQILDMAREIADSMATVLIQGESGTGKEVLARYIHHHSERRDRPFVAVNCAALPEGLLESELFGHEKGAFTGAVLSRKGKFELANHGTLLLDEVSEMPLSLQAKLLRVLQEREIDPIGSQRSVQLDVRVLATTNRNLTAYVREGNFREDLFYRLQVIAMEIPPLRQRREDIIPMAEFFVRKHCRVNRRPRKRFDASMRAYLLEQSWRGNVRELENFLERAVLLCKEEAISPEKIFLRSFCPPRGMDLEESLGRGDACVAAMSASAPLAGTTLTTATISDATPARPEEPARNGEPWHASELLTLEEMERRLIMQTLERVGGNRTRAADLLGVSVRTIRNKLSQYGLGGAERAAATGA